MTRLLMLAATIAVGSLAGIAAPAPQQWTFALTSPDGLTPHEVRATAATHMGRAAVRLVPEPGFAGYSYAVVKGPALQDGTIEVDVAGRPGDGAAEGARGFIGVAFRVQPDDKAFECFYIRPTNGRADDQLRRNHSTQYIAHPGFPWEKLRAETPGMYESYVDLVTGEWTHLKIEVRDRRASLFVNRAAQPVLIVKDLKLVPASGGVALWLGPTTEAFFSNLRVAGDR